MSTTWAVILAKAEVRCGLGTAATPAQIPQVQEFALDRLAAAVARAWWPNLMVVESRPFAALWLVGTTYAKDAIVWDGDQKYYQSLTAGNVGNLVTDATKWLELTEIDPVIPLVQTGKTTIGTLEGVYPTEENAENRAGALRVEIRGGNIYILDQRGPAVPYACFRKGIPDVLAQSPEAVPDELVPYIVLGVWAAWLLDQGKSDSADRAEAQAELRLQDAVTKEVDQQVQTPRTRVLVSRPPISGYVYRGGE